jgi:acetate kinase
MRGILTGQKINPSLPHVVVFDTAFHHSIQESVYLYPIPLEYSLQHKIRKYGFHGISYQFISSVLYDHYRSTIATPACVPTTPATATERATVKKNIAIFHLGSGCSAAVLTLCVDSHRPYEKTSTICHDTTMGFTPLDGLMMGTRSGSIDPSIISHLCAQENSLDDVMNILNKKSGLLGVSGMTQDVRDLLSYLQSHHGTTPTASQSDLLQLLSTPTDLSSSSSSASSSSTLDSVSQRVILSLNMFCHRAAKEMLGLTASLQSPLDAIVFTGGIGENSAIIRTKILSHLRGFTQIKIDENLNQQNHFCLTARDSPVQVHVIPTNEELQIAIETHDLINK